MWKYQQGTPCPPAFAQHTDFFSPPVFVDKQRPTSAVRATSTTTSAGTNVLDDVFEDYNENTTRNIAKLMRDEFKNARLGMPQKPRRNQGQPSAVGVYEENNGEQQEEKRLEKGAGLLGGGAIKARRPQKIKLETVKEDRSLGARDSTTCLGPDESRLDDCPELEENAARDDKTTTLKPARDSRRRTIWVPSDDTTVLSIHPGAYDQTLRDDTICLPPQRGLSTRTGKANASIQPKTSSRQSMAAAPKRAPLRALPASQPNVILNDRVKCINGKENIPPNAAISKDKIEKVLNKLEARPVKAVSQPISKPVGATRTSLLREQNAALQAGQMSHKKRSAPEPKEEPRKTKVSVTKDIRPRLSAERRTSTKLREHIANARASQTKQVPSKLSTPSFQPQISANLSRYPVLVDDLVQPELYEDNWLSHQEVALTQLINSVFQQSDSKSLLARDDVSSIRSKMLRLYQQSSVVTLHKRLKASLTCGALSMPKDSKDLPRLREDVGMRRQFLDLWVQSYKLDCLQAAAEVVVGRTMSVRPRDAASIAQSLGSASGMKVSAQEKEIRRFLLAFLVHHEDALDGSAPHQKHSHAPENTDERSLRIGSPEWFWQRTVLNSLMLVNLLDNAKSSGAISGCLFQTTSIRKSSNSILHAFTRMVLPWIGDVTRPLGHLDYAVPHSQLPLSEYNYRIDNLATDLRNGVLLTRFVELLVYPSTALQEKQEQTLTLSLPDGETLTSIFEPGQEDTWVLSQHLKFPCAGRAQKLHNVQVALSALQGTKGSLTEAAISSTRPEDIVDGHREKTLSLLWSLVIKWGLGMLVDWEELKRETKRFAADELGFDSRRYLDEDALDEIASLQPDAHEQATLLKAWAASVCATKGITVTNLTTSFASAIALSCIVSTYSEVLPSTTTVAASKTKRSGPPNPTADALRVLGCSESFTALFASTTAIPCRSTTTALLAFLASRLLPLARSHRAAKTIQRAYRLCLARRAVTKRVTCMVLARECATVVRMKDQFEDAAVVLQRAWRAVVLRRERKAYADALVFQTMARGWAARKVFRRALLGAAGAAGGRRVMGGW